MRYLERSTLGELTGLNYRPDIRVKARELLQLLEEEKTMEAAIPLPLVNDAPQHPAPLN